MGLVTVELKEFNSASLSGTYQNFGSVLGNAALKLQLINASTVAAYVTDGTSVWYVPASTTITFDEVGPASDVGDAKYYAAKGAQLQIKQVTTAGTGTIIAHVVRKRT
jgi:hypothetical protein